MKRYAVFLRGVSPMNLRMPDLKRALEEGGFLEVRTLLSSGNVAFNTSLRSASSIERACEQAMMKGLGQTFSAFVRPIDELRALIERDPYQSFKLPKNAKRVVTFVRGKLKTTLDLPIERDGASILLAQDGEIFSAYLPGPKGPVFMTLIEKTFGKDVTTRTWDTVKKVAQA